VPMRRSILPIATAVGLMLSLAVHAQSPTMTATCNDGSPYSGTTRSGACRGHGGVKTWNAAAPSTPAPATGAAAAPAAPASSAPAPAPTAPALTTRGTPGTGQVWVNTASKVYHCPGDRYYGKTKAGEYMPEAQAKSSGFHADHGKACVS
jgi:hypothetical protein